MIELNDKIVFKVDEPFYCTVKAITVDFNTGKEIDGEYLHCDSNRIIRCEITVNPGAKFKTVKRAFLVLKNRGGSNEKFSVHQMGSMLGVLQEPAFGYVENRRDTNNNITDRVIDISSFLYNAERDSFVIGIKSISNSSFSAYKSGCTVEVEYLEDDDFIPDSSILEKKVGAKGVFKTNLINGKLFYTQSLFVAKGGRMPLALSMTYNAKDCDENSPNGIAMGIKGWTFNYAQCLKAAGEEYTLLDGTHKYRTFKPATNNTMVKFDASSKSGFVLTQNNEGYAVDDNQTTTYQFDTNMMLTKITKQAGTTPVQTIVERGEDGKIVAITDGMGDKYEFTYATDMILIKKGTVTLVNISLSDERVSEVEYVLSGIKYTFTYDDNGQLISVEETASNQKVVLEYNTLSAVTAIKKYINKTECVSLESDFLEYRLLETRVKKCKNTDNSWNPYITMTYMFAENGETIFTGDISNGTGQKMIFRTKNDYEKHVERIRSISEANQADDIAVVSAENKTYSCYLGDGVNRSWGNAEYDNTKRKSKYYVFAANINIIANNYIVNDGSQYARLVLKDGTKTLCTIDLDNARRGNQIKSSPFTLSRGVHNLSVTLEGNIHVDLEISSVYIFESKHGGQFEYISGFANANFPAEQDDTETYFYINEGGYELHYGDESISDVKFTTKDYILTTISRLKKPTSFEVWYNDGTNMLSGGSNLTLVKNNVSKAIENIKCCSVSRGIDKTVFTTFEPSNLADATFKACTKTRIDTATDTTYEYETSEVESDYFIKTEEYDSYMRPLKVTNEKGITVEYTYNEFGETLTEKTTAKDNAALNTLFAKSYLDGNLSTESEKRAGITYVREYTYDENDSLVSMKTPKNQILCYDYSEDNEKVTEISTVLNESTINNNMEYSGDILDRLSHNNTNINFEYDERNNVKSIEIGGTVILSKEIIYGPSNTHSVTTYGNGFKLKKYYDKYNRLIKVTDVTNNETQICAYIYSDSDVADEVVDPTDSSLTISANSKLYVEIDNVVSTRTNYIYDEFGELKEKKKGDIREFFGSRDRFNRPISEYFINGSVSVRKGITYENKNSDIIKHESIQSPTGYTYINYTRDGLERLAKVKVVQGDCGYSKEFSYIARGTEASPEGTTNYVGKVSYYNYTNGSDTLEKEEAIGYDADGNIVKYGDNTYVYDNLGRIVRENNKALDKTFVFEYNIGGNIVKKTEYAYTTEALDTVVAAAIYEYTYDNAWKDQLTSFGGKTITYDGAGNPTTYQGNRLFWSRGRLLTGWSAADGCSAISIAYDANGIRTSKTKTDDYVTTETRFVYDNEGRLRTEIEGEFTRHYIYSHQGIEGYEENGERFIYRKNIFGDITAIYKGANKVAEYTYDAWGNCTIILNTSGYGSRNPFRYRGYYWDEDLKMYYLMTRYYDPKTGRFINADTPDYLDPETLGGLNLYAYCNNNPVMNTDSMGHFFSSVWGTILDIGITVVSAVVGAVVGATLGGVAGAVVGAVVTTSVVNNAVNAIYYNSISPDENNEIFEHEKDQEAFDYHDKKSYYVDNGYVNRWDLLKYIKTKNGDGMYDYEAWNNYAEYSVHMDAWIVSSWAHKSQVPVFNQVAESSIHTGFGDNNFLIDLGVIVWGLMGL